MRKIEICISSRKWKEATTELMNELNTGSIDVSNYDLWGKLAGAIETGLNRRWAERRQFWFELREAVESAEKRQSVQTHKGLIYFKIGAMNLVTGKTFRTAADWFQKAYKEDIRTYSKHWKDATQQSAYRLLLIVRAFESFCRRIRNSDTRRLINNIVRQHRDRIGLFIVGTYDRSILSNHMASRLPDKYMDKIMGRNPYRTLVEQNYRGAEWVIGHRNEWQLEQTNIAKYGIAQAVVVLCGTTIEGILLKRVIMPNRKSVTLAALTKEYLKKLEKAPELASGLLFLWFARDLIHPEVVRRTRSVIVDLNFAQYSVELTKHVIALISNRSRRMISP